MGFISPGYSRDSILSLSGTLCKCAAAKCLVLCAACGIHGAPRCVHGSDICGVQGVVELLSCPHHISVDYSMYISLEWCFILL